MTIELKKIAGMGVILAALAAAPAMAQSLNGWDSDGNSALNEQEFNSGWGSSFDGGSAYGTWDADGDGSLTEEEFNTGVFNSYDDDGSGAIEEPEFGDVGDDLGDGGFWDV